MLAVESRTRYSHDAGAKACAYRRAKGCHTTCVEGHSLDSADYPSRVVRPVYIKAVQVLSAECAWVSGVSTEK